jgi:sec-independent protein translocase protein TatC
MTLLYELGLLIARFYVPKPADDDSADANDSGAQTTA